MSGEERRTEYTITEIRDGADELSAYAVIPGGTIIRLVSNGDGDDWKESVEIGAPGNWSVLRKGRSLAVASEYNAFIEKVGAD